MIEPTKAKPERIKLNSFFFEFWVLEKPTQLKKAPK